MRLILIITTFFIILFYACSNKIIPIPETIEEPSLEKPTLIEAIKIDEGRLFSTGPCEPSICIDPNNKDRIVAGSILDKVYTSADGGKTWTKNTLKSSLGVYGDPVVRANYKGDFFYAHLSNPKDKAYASIEFLDRIVIQKSSDGGHTWNDGSYTLPRSPKDQDKQWLAVDPEDNTIYITWTEFDLYGDADTSLHSRILFSKSTDDAASWTDPVILSQIEGNCIDDDQTTEGAVPTVGPEGQIYVSWSYDQRIYFDKSYDQGLSWLDEDIIVTNQPGGWTYDIPGLGRCNGMPITIADRSQSPYRGHIYVNWSDQRNGSDDTDIWLARSTDEGNSWSDPIRVNDDLPGKQQFLSWMEIDQETGFIYIVFYDRRSTEDEATDVYLGISKNGGQSFENIKINSESFTPNKFIFFGDYNDISVQQGRVRPIWTQFNDGKLSVWTALIDF